MELWRAEPGDVVRLPESFWPRVVTVTDSEYARGECNRIHWEAPGARGSTVLPDLPEIDLLSTERPGKQPFVLIEPEPEAGQ